MRVIYFIQAARIMMPRGIEEVGCVRLVFLAHTTMACHPPSNQLNVSTRAS